VPHWTLRANDTRSSDIVHKAPPAVSPTSGNTMVCLGILVYV
jgi:hypothetical protein